MATELPEHVLLPLFGTPCLVCAYPATYVHRRRVVVHEIRAIPPCKLPALPALPSREVTR